jgi:hypothetical protein
MVADAVGAEVGSRAFDAALIAVDADNLGHQPAEAAGERAVRQPSSADRACAGTRSRITAC